MQVRQKTWPHTLGVRGSRMKSPHTAHVTNSRRDTDVRIEDTELQYMNQFG